MILIVSNHDFKQNLKLLAFICKTLSKTLHITKSIAIQNKNGRTPTQIKYTQRQSKMSDLGEIVPESTVKKSNEMFT